jgi:hypothetical protein
MNEIVRQVGRTVRYSLDGWGRTVRLLALLGACASLYAWITH